jgi:hypothetical protein
MRCAHALAGLTVLALAVSSPNRAAESGDASGSPAVGKEPDDVALSLTLDEHLFVNPRADEDYNGGGELTLSGARAATWLSLDPLLGWIDRPFGLKPEHAGEPSRALAAGLLIFTPKDLTATSTVKGDRPYASLFFVSNGRRYVPAGSSVAYDSTLTLGALGLESADGVQSALHRLVGSVPPRGWSHQISAGGEPTARYSLARQQVLDQHLSPGWGGSDLKWTAEASAGTVTEASIALNARFGHIASPWWATTPEQTVYTLEPQPALPRVSEAASPELFFLAGARLKVRAYNAFLEGQFRHSDLRYSPGSLNILLGEAWLGAQLRTESGWELRYIMRWESPEIRSGFAARSYIWGSLEIAKSFGR